MKKINHFKEQSIYITLLFNFYVVIWWLEIGKRIEFFAKIRLEFIVGSILIILLLTIKKDKTAKNINNDLISAIFIYIFVLFISLPLAIDFDVAWDTFFNRVIKFSFMCFFIAHFANTPKTFGYFLFSSFLAFFKIGQEAMFGKLTGNMVWQNQGIPRLHGTQGTEFGHPNSLSGKTVTLLPFLWFLTPLLKHKLILVLVVVQLIFTLNIVIFTGSRTGYMALLAFLFFVYFLSKNKKKYIISIFILSMISINFIPDPYIERFLSSFTGQEAEGASSDARKNLFFDSLTVFTENPLGVGANCFPIEQAMNERRVQATHNLYTQLLAETGIQGFIAFSWLIYVLIKKINKVRIGFRKVIEEIKNVIDKDPNASVSLKEEIKTCRFYSSLADALYIAILMRLILGIFGHDVFEIYWWLFCGISMSMSILSTKIISNINSMLNKVQV